MELRGRVALVTGGARRVGKAITLALARAGAHVIINHHASPAAAHETEWAARALGVEALAFQADITDRARVDEMVRAATARFGAIDLLVNNASPFEPTPFPTADVAAWQRVIEQIIHGSFYVTNAVAPGMLAQQRGAIINLVDMFAFSPRKNFAAHGVGKAGLLAMTRQFALDLAPHVRVNAIAPGPVLPPDDYTPERMIQTASRTVLKRWGTADDIAETVLFLARAEYITGEVIVVDGGEHLGQ